MRIACVMAALAATAAADAQTLIENPAGGWRDSGGQPAGFRQSVNYPASSVNVDKQPLSAQIRGRVARAPKAPPSRAPATLVVNGVAMPLAVGADGRFARPYAFGRGGNGVEVRAPDGSRRRVSFYEANPGRNPARLRVVLSWDTDGTDLDLHVVSPDGQHVFYGARTAANGGALDVDVTTGYGPEIYANPSPPAGLYHVYVNYYGAGDGNATTVTGARIAVITEEGTLAERQQVFSVPMRKPGELTLVRSFHYP